MLQKFLFIATMLVLSFTFYAQKKEFITIGIVGEINNSERNSYSGYSFTYEQLICKNHGFEIGFNERSISYLIYNEFAQDTKRIKYNYVSLPVLYKFYNPIIDISTGINIDYNVGWRDISKSTNSKYEVELSETNTKISAGWYLKLGKSIPITSKLYITPEIHFNPVLGLNYYYGTSIRLKYKL